MTTGNRAVIRCKYCGRDNFKKEYGLTNHQRSGPCYVAMMEERRRQTGGAQPRETRHRPPGNDRVEDAEMEEITQGFAAVNQDTDSDSEGGAAMMSDGAAGESGDDGSSEASGDSASTHSTSSSANESEPPSEDETEDESHIPEETLLTDGEGPITSIRDQFRKYCDDHPKIFRPRLIEAEVMSLELLSIMFKKRTALNAHRPLMEWHLKSSGELQEGQDLNGCRSYMTREATMKSMRGRYNMDNKYPHSKKVKLPISGEVVRLTLHDPLSVVQALLTDPRLEDSDYCFHGNNPLAPPPEKHTILRDVNTGLAHRKTYQKMIDPDPRKRQQLFPILLYIDGSAITHFKDFEVTQLKISSGVFSREARLKAHTWKTVGYIEKVHKTGGLGRDIWDQAEHMESEGVRSGDDDGDSVLHELEGIGKEPLQDLHAQLGVTLEEMDPLFERGFLWDQRLNGALHRDIHYIPHLVLARCDNKEAMALCGQYGQLTHTKQLCRMCHVLVQEADNHLHKPVYKTEPKIRGLVNRVDKDGLKEISQHYLKNSFHNHPFHKANTRGIHGACPVDMLHTLLLGLFKCVRDVFFSYVGTSSHSAKLINGLSKEHAKCFSRQSDKDVPPMRFSKGIQEGMLMGKEHRGVILLILVMVKSKAGGRILQKTRKGNFKTQEAIKDWAFLVEMLLLMEGYLNVPEMDVADVRRLEKGIRFIMYLTRMVSQRTDKMGLKLLKFHSLLHIVDNIALFGVPLECDTSANESHHKPTKQAAKLTQMNHSTFNTQTATRLIDFDVVDFARCEMEDGKVAWRYYHDLKEEGMEVDARDSEGNEGVATGQKEPETDPKDAMIQVHLNDQTNEVEFKMVSRSMHKERTHINRQLLEFLWDLQQLLHPELGGECLRIHTRIVRGKTSFRGHPNCRGKGPWRDWAWVDFGGDGVIPCQIYCFAVIPQLQVATRRNLGGIRIQEGIFAVVESGRLVSEDGWDLDILTPYEKEVGLDTDGEVLLDNHRNVRERVFYLADTNAITAPCCVVPDIGGPKNRYLVVTSREEWPDHFVDWLHSIKDLKDEDMELEEATGEAAEMKEGEEDPEEEDTEEDEEGMMVESEEDEEDDEGGSSVENEGGSSVEDEEMSESD